MPAPRGDRPRCDVVVVGGGPAGLSAALTAARAGRSVTLMDVPDGRNFPDSRAINGWIGQPNLARGAFRESALADLGRFEDVRVMRANVEAVSGSSGSFAVAGDDGSAVSARRVILATGVLDLLPAIPGLSAIWGERAFHCAYCDGFEHRGTRWGVLASEPAARSYLPMMRGWTYQLTAFMGPETTGPDEETLRDLGIDVRREDVTAVAAAGDGLVVSLSGGATVGISSLWLAPDIQQAPLVQSLGIRTTDDGMIDRDALGETSLPGVFAVGDCANACWHQVTEAIADGVRVVAKGVNQSIIAEDLEALLALTS